MPYSVTQGSGLNIDSITYTHPITGLVTHIPVITNLTVSSVGTNTGGIGTSTYLANQVMGTSQFTFSGVALKAGLGGVIQNASLYCAVVSTGQYLIRLFDKPLTTSTFTNGQAYSAFNIPDSEAQNFVGDIEFSFPLASANNTLYSVSGVSMAFTTDPTGSPNLYGVLLSRNSHSLAGATGQDIKITLEILL